MNQFQYITVLHVVIFYSLFDILFVSHRSYSFISFYATVAIV